MVRRLCVVWLKSPLQDFVKSLTRLEPGLPSSYFADLCPGSKIGREGQVSCETLISNQRFKKPNISFPFSEDRALHIQESCSHKLGGGGWGDGGQTQRDWNGTFIGSCQALAAKLADLLISLWKLPREKGPQEIVALLLWRQCDGGNSLPTGVEISRYLNFADTVCLAIWLGIGRRDGI